MSGIRGRAWVFGDDVNTDDIIPATYLDTIDPAEMAAHCMEGIDPAFAGKVKPGDVIVGGRNFGCGSSREHAPVAIKAAGVSAVIAATMARIFFRNGINIGLPILECPEAASAITEGDEVEIDQNTGLITNHTKGQTYQAKPFPPFMQELIAAGGLMPWVKERIDNA